MILVIIFAGLILFAFLICFESLEKAFFFLLIFLILVLGITIGVSSSEEFFESSGRKINSFD